MTLHFLGENYKRLLISMVVLFGCISPLFAQLSISGPTCVVAGTQYSYSLGGSEITGQTSMNWNQTTGTIVGSNSGTPLAEIQVTFASTGTYYVKVSTTNPTGSASLTVTVITNLNGGTITNPSQNINYNTVPGSIYCTNATGGTCSTPNYIYQWQSSPNNVTYTNISGATGPSLSFTAGLTSAMYYRRFVTETVSGNTAYSTVAQVTVYPALVPGSISPSSQLINYNTVSSQLTLSGVSGGTNSYSYVWQSSPDGVSWSGIPNVTGTTYSPPALQATTYYNVVVSSNGAYATSSSAAVTVNPEVFGGSISPAYASIASGTSPGEITSTVASGGGCGGAYLYQWQSSTDGINFTNISGATAQNYTPGNLTAATWFRRQVNCSGDLEYTNVAQTVIGATAPDMNFVTSRTILKPGVTDTATAAGLTSPYDVQQVTQYFDGLGRPVQTVAKQITPLQKDFVSFNVYDYYQREVDKYLPYAASTSDGNYKVTAISDQYNFNSVQYPSEQYYYSEVSFENSPLNRPLATYAPGMSWAGSSVGVSDQHLVNQASDSVRVWNIAYPVGSIPTSTAMYAAGALYKNITIDENGHQVVEYKDLSGHVVLKKVQIAASPGTAHVGWLCTYYVYDDMGNLRFVLQPQAVVLINSSWSVSTGIANGLCFRYEYDSYGRMSIKKVPGAGEAWMVYDGRDRLVMTQDSNLRVQGKWLVNEYDAQNRPDSAGLLTDSHNQVYHQNLALNSSYYPVVASYPYQLQTETFYDNYSWVPTGGGLSATMNTANSTNGTYFITGYNTSPTYSQPITYFPITRGEVTGTFAYVIGSTTGQVMTDVNFYDDRNRVIQAESVNITGGVDLTTSQYDFTGKPLRTLLIHNKNGNTVQQHIVVTKLSYDAGFRLKNIFKNIDGAASDQLIDSMQYNELGQLRAKYLGNNVDSLVYAYNIRGWLTGINQNYLAGNATSNYFGMQLRYNSNSSVAGSVSYNPLQYNGNIAGQVWKSAGDGVPREYDYCYDNANRLNKGNFSQSTDGGNTWTNSPLCFSTYGLDVSDPNNQDAITYDANGNIVNMINQGFKVGGSVLIDVLYYTYQANSNQLSQVIDGANDSTSKLGDFHYNASTKQSTDYTYDGDGNLLSDNNKAIDSIRYNYLNLPDSVHMKGKGRIVYTYDAKGTKWKKVITDSLARHSTTILYIGGFVYQQNDSFSNLNGVDTLQFMAHEEGRARWAFQKFTTGTTGYSFQYDFFEKDHLGNTRIVLTQERDTTNYLASMERQFRPTEVQLFGNITSTSYPWASMPNYQNIPNNIKFAYTSPNDSVSRVDYTGSGGQATGPSLLLKVMSGDTVNFSVQCYYNSNTITTTNSSFSSVLNSLATGLLGTAGGAAEGTLTGLTSSTGTVYGGLNSFFTTNDAAPPAGYPKAYLNWIFLDDQFNYQSSMSGSVPAASSTYLAGTMNTVAPGSQIPLNKNGYLYIWVSNETQGWDVFFDNLAVQYKQGPLLEENHYYPFGLTIAGISDKALKGNYAENKYRFNKGSELQNKEFSDGSGLELYETPLRSLDPQLARWWQIDSKPTEAESPYSAMGDNPILRNDFLGDSSIPYPARVNQPNFDPLLPPGVGPNKDPNDETSKSDQGQNPPQTKEKSNSSGESEPLFGSTSTLKASKKQNILSTGILGDEISVSGFSAKVTGEEGLLGSTDVTHNNLKEWEGSSISSGGPVHATFGVNKDGSLQGGVSVFGYEGHLTVGFGVGLGQFGGGGSHAKEDGTSSGGDLTIRPGSVTAAAVATSILLPVLALF
jgi:hypothetical protein